MLRMGWRSERVNEIMVPASICPSVHLSIHLPISHSAGDWTQSLSSILGKGCTAELCIASLVSAFITWRFCLPGTIWGKKRWWSCMGPRGFAQKTLWRDQGNDLIITDDSYADSTPPHGCQDRLGGGCQDGLLQTILTLSLLLLSCCSLDSYTHPLRPLLLLRNPNTCQNC